MSDIALLDEDARFVALRGKPGFQNLIEGELRLIAGYAGTISFAPGETVLASAAVPSLLYVTVAGTTCSKDPWLPPVFDAPALLFGRNVRHRISAGDEGLTTLAITRQHVFTIARECPEFVIDLLKMAKVDQS